MRTQKADPAIRARATGGLVTRPLASVLLAMGAISLAAASGSAMASSNGATIATSSSATPTTTATGQTLTRDGTLVPGDRRTRLSD
jgi:hypothetical protein